MDTPSIFTRILSGEIPGSLLHEDDSCFVLADINPQAPLHLLIIPKKPLVGVQGAEAEDQALLGHLLLVARKMADAEGLEAGYRLVINSGSDGGQEVPHLHIHLLGRRKMTWPPG